MKNLKTFEQFTYNSDNKVNEGWILDRKYKKLDRTNDLEVTELLKKSINTDSNLEKILIQKVLKLSMDKKLEFLDTIYTKNAQEDNTPLANALGIGLSALENLIDKIKGYIFRDKLELEPAMV